MVRTKDAGEPCHRGTRGLVGWPTLVVRHGQGMIEALHTALW